MRIIIILMTELFTHEKATKSTYVRMWYNSEGCSLLVIGPSSFFIIIFLQQIWNDFLNLSEEEQQVVIRQKPVTHTPVVQVNRGSTQTDDSSAERGKILCADFF